MAFAKKFALLNTTTILFQLVEKDSGRHLASFIPTASWASSTNQFCFSSNAGDYLKVRFEGDRGYVQNVRKDTVPPILIASLEGKVTLERNNLRHIN